MFAEDLLARLPRSSKGPSAYQQKERTAAAFVKANAQYALLSDSDEELELPPAPTTAAVPSSKDKRLRKTKVCFPCPLQAPNVGKGIPTSLQSRLLREVKT
jgi:hypothetical protein